MKSLALIITALISLNANANTPVFFQGFDVVNEKLDTSVFSFKNKIINFSMNEQTAALSILNNICPRRPGMVQCKAMPIPVLVAEYQLQLTEVDACGVRTYTSNVVDNPAYMQTNVSENSQLVIKDNRFSVCEIAYSAQFYVKLIINKTNLESGNTLTFDSYLGFNSPKTFKNEAKGFTEKY